MTFASRVLLALLGLFLLSECAFAQVTPVPTTTTVTTPSPAGIGAGIGMGLSIIGAGLGIGLIGFSALASIARQPEQAGKIQGAMILLAALVEGAAIISLILCLLVVILA